VKSDAVAGVHAGTVGRAKPKVKAEKKLVGVKDAQAQDP
jgi:hypothetical protein